jgi:hypothetical protein
MDNTINDLVEVMKPKEPKATTSYGGDIYKGLEEHRYGRDGGHHEKEHEGPAHRGHEHKGSQSKEGFKTPAYSRDPYLKGPLLDGPALIAPVNKPKSKKDSRDDDPQGDYWYGKDDAEEGDGDRDRDHEGADDEDDKPRKSPRKYKSLDSPDEKPSFRRDEPEDEPAPSKESKDSKDTKKEVKDKEPSEPCINIEDVPAAKGGYKFVPPAQRKNLCKKPAPAIKPDTKDKEYESMSDADGKEDKAADEREGDGKDDSKRKSEVDEADDSPAAEKPAERDDKPSKKQDSNKNKKSKRSEQPREEEREQEGDKPAKKRNSRSKDKSSSEDEYRPERREEEEYNKSPKKHDSSRRKDEQREEYPKKDKHEEEKEEEIWIYHPWPIVRDRSIDFKHIPEDVQENFWLKANRDGFMYMPKWDPQLAQDGYHPHYDRAGNNPGMLAPAIASRASFGQHSL